MEYKQGCTWLNRARIIDFQIKEKIYIIEGLYTCCGLQGISYDKLSVITSPENKFERIMGDIDKEQRELNQLRKDKQAVLYEISEKLKSLNPSPEKTILVGYYIGCQDMNKIAKDIGYELKYCYKLRKKGIEML